MKQQRVQASLSDKDSVPKLIERKRGKRVIIMATEYPADLTLKDRFLKERELSID